MARQMNRSSSSGDQPALPSLENTRAVAVSNLPKQATEAWLRMLFSPIGTIESVHFTPANENAPGQASILFATTEQAHSSLGLDGYVALGLPMQVRLRSENPHRALPMPSLARLEGIDVEVANRRGSFNAPRSRGAENAPSHKNLYVLNLPLDATTDQLAALFGSYGAVVHCVILAMLDAQARRRGFIDMSSADEAKGAIEGLNGFVWHGYPIEVSYAIVQRSGGPFDQTTGRNVIKRNVPRNRFNTGPRRVPSDSAIPAGASGLPSPLFAPRHVSNPSPGPPSPAYSEESSAIATDPCTIFLSGLDPVAILDNDDLKHALEPYGFILGASLSRDEHGISRGFGVVTFATEAEATSARNGLDGKVLNGRKITAHNLHYQTNRAYSPPASTMSRSLPGYGMPAMPNSAPHNITTFQQSFAHHGMPQRPAGRFTPSPGPFATSYQTTLPSSGRRLDQIPMGAIGASANDTWGPSAMRFAPTSRPAPGLTRTNSMPRHFDMKMDNPLFGGRGQLGEAFVPKGAAAMTDRLGGPNLGDADAARARVRIPMALKQPNADHGGLKLGSPTETRSPTSALQTPATNTPWQFSSRSLGLENLSPESTLSTDSTASSYSHLNTPEAGIRSNVAVNGEAWGFPHHTSPAPWAPTSGAYNRFGKSLAGEDVDHASLRALQRHSPPHSVDEEISKRRPRLAPVGHEKSSSSSSPLCSGAPGSDPIAEAIQGLQIST